MREHNPGSGNHANSAGHTGNSTDQVDETYYHGEVSFNTFDELNDSLEELSNTDVTNAAVEMLEEEYERVSRYLSEDELCAAVVCLNSVFEDYVEHLLIIEKREELDRPLSDYELEHIRLLGHDDRKDELSRRGVLEEYINGSLSALYKVRIDPAHSRWGGIDLTEKKHHIDNAHDHLLEHIDHVKDEHLS